MSNFDALLAYSEWSWVGGINGIDEYYAQEASDSGTYYVDDSDAAYEAMLDRDASRQTEIDASHGV